MLLKLRILFTILSAVCIAAVFPVGAFFGFIWALVPVIAALAFYAVMLVCKNKQEEQENREKNGEQPPSGDFFHPAQKDEPQDKE